MRRLGITGKLVVSSACIFLTLGLAVAWYSAAQLRSTLYEELMRRLEAQSLNWIEANLQALTVLRNPATLERLAGDLKREGIAYVILLNADGKRLAAAGVPAGLRRQQPAAKIGGTRSQPAETSDGQDRRYFELATPISASGTGMNRDLQAIFSATTQDQAWGEVRVGVDQAVFDRNLSVLARRNSALYAVLVLLALAINIVLAKRMVTPISKMGRVATQIAGGELDVRVEEGTRLQDEVGELVRNFNQMAARLAENRAEMNLLYAGLEEKVRERTLELEQANRRLQELDALKSHFLSTVSHEFRSPLTSIKAFSQILVDSDPDPATRQRFLGIIEKESDRLSRLISDLLDLAKIESGSLSWSMAAAELKQIVADAAIPLASLAAEKGVTLEVAESQAQPVWGDADRLQQVVTNLIHNAVKFCPHGGRVQLRVDRDGDYARVAVEDDGPGIPAEDRQRVFERFYQGTKNRSAGPGTGLGLAICREIVLHHKGEIWVESDPGRGSTFYFTVPLKKGAAPAACLPGDPAEGRA